MPYCNGLFYRRYKGGAGVFSHPTILLHGLGGTHLSWSAQLRRLPDQDIFAIDLPGHGMSRIAACVRVSCQVEALRQFAQSMGMQKINLVGHSMGAMVAYTFASQYPDSIRKLSLLSLGTSYRYAQELEQLFSLEKTKRNGVDFLMEHAFHPKVPRKTRKDLFDPLLSTRASLLYADAQACSNFTIDRSFRSPSFPVQLITGKDDALVPLSAVRDLSCHIGNASLQVLEACGHSVIFEKPDQIVRLLAEFLNETAN